MPKSAFLIVIFLFLTQLTFAQKEYEEWWNEIEELEIQGKSKSALEESKLIYKQAKKERNEKQLVRAFLYRTKYELILKENPKMKVVENFICEIEEQKTPVKQILSSIFAESLADYRDMYAYQIRERKEASKADFNEWNDQDFKHEIQFFYEESISDQKKLTKLKIEDYPEILKFSTDFEAHYNSLYELVALRYLAYLKSKNKRNKAEDVDEFLSYFITDTTAFSVSTNFYENHNFNTAHQKVLEFYRELEQHTTFTSQTKLLYKLQRLDFVYENSFLENRKELYIQALNKLKQQSSKSEEKHFISYFLSAFYYKNADKKKHPDYLEKSLSEVKHILESASSSFLKSLAIELKNSIYEVDYKLETEDLLLANQPNKALLKHKNADSLYVWVYNDFPEVKNKKKKNKIVYDFTQNNSAECEEIYQLKNPFKFYKTTTEILLPEMADGTYLLVYSTKENPKDEDEIFYQKIRSATFNFAVQELETENEIHVFDAKTGEPIPNAKVEMKVEKTALNYNDITDEKGMVKFNPKDERNRFWEGKITVKNEELPISLQARNRGRKVAQLNSVIYSDRDIYRPGQTMYYKGILYSQEGNQYKVKKELKGKLLLQDSKNQTKDTIPFKTNDFGSFFGEIDLPKNGFNGRYKLRVVFDKEDEKQIENYRFSGYAQSKDFRIEEYKRPKFEVDFNSINDHFELGNSVCVDGKTKAFFGGNISDAKVKYTVKRQSEYLQNFPLDEISFNLQTLAVASGTTETDEHGDFQFEFETQSYEELNKKLHLTYAITVEITDQNGETQEGKTRVIIGNPGVEAKIKSEENVEIGEEEEFAVRFKDANQVKVPVDAELKIYKLKSSDRIFSERPWDIPENQQISKREFHKYFPHQTYDSTDVKEKREKELVKKINVKKDSTFQYDELTDFDSGEYEIVVDAKYETHQLSDKKYITIKNPNSAKKVATHILKVDFEEIESDATMANMNFEVNRDSLYVYYKLYDENEEIKERVELFKRGENQKQISFPEDSRVLKLKYAYAFSNHFESGFDYKEIPVLQEQLELELEHFTDKMRPGEKETWGLKLKNGEDESVDAEILAGMYDQSLDRLASNFWPERIKRFQPAKYFETNSFELFYKGLVPGRKYGAQTPKFKRFSPQLPELKNFGYSFTTYQFNRSYVNELKMLHENRKAGKIMGYVYDVNGNAIPEVTVQTKNKNQETETDYRGYFAISVKKGDEIYLTAEGFEEKQVEVDDDLLQIRLFGTSTYAKRLTRTADQRFRVSHYETEDVEEVASALNGKVAGLRVGSNADDPEVLSMSGNASAKGLEHPIYVIDGEITTSEEFSALNSRNVESMTILKGAEATAKYGEKAENGVLVIVTKEAEEALQQVEFREDLKETAFFYPDLRTDKNGNIKIEFESPEALTKWKFRAFAHDKELNSAYVEKSVITQKDLNLIPNFPRFFREKDRLTISVKVNNQTEDKLNGMANLKLIDDETDEELTILKSTKNQNFQISEEGNTTVEWEVEIPKSVHFIRYEVAAKANDFTDGERGIIPVLSNREFVTETMAFWLNPKEKKDFVFENLKNNKSSTLENHKLILDYTANPSWTALQVLPFIVKAEFRGSEQVFANYYSRAITEKILAENSKIQDKIEKWSNREIEELTVKKEEDFENTPWLATSYSIEDQQKLWADIIAENKNSGETRENLSKLNELQLSSGAFPWFHGGQANRAISIHILSGLGRIGEPNQNELEKDYQEISAGLLKYLNAEFVKDQKKKDSKQRIVNHDLHYLYATSFFEKPTASVHQYQEKVIADFKDDWLKLSLRQKIVLGIISKRNGDEKFAKKVVESLKENAVIDSESGMYWKENKAGWLWYEAPIETQALAIELFTEVKESKDHINALKTWLLKQKQTQAWETTRATTDAIYALLIQGTDLVTANHQATINVGDEQFDLDTETDDAGYFQKVFSADEITPDQGEITITNKSESPQYGGMYWEYFEDSDKLKSSGLEELAIEKEMFKVTHKSGKEKLIPIQKSDVEVGDELNIEIQISAQTDFEFMHLKDKRSAAFEPKNVLSGYTYKNRLRYYQVTKDTGTHFFFDRIPKGKYQLSYRVYVNNAGDFSIGNAELKSLYAPEFSSQTSGGRIQIEK